MCINFSHYYKHFSFVYVKFNVKPCEVNSNREINAKISDFMNAIGINFFV